MNAHTIARAIQWMYENLTTQQGRDLICAYALTLAQLVQEPNKPARVSRVHWLGSYDYIEWRDLVMSRYLKTRRMLVMTLKTQANQRKQERMLAEQLAQQRMTELSAQQQSRRQNAFSQQAQPTMFASTASATTYTSTTLSEAYINTPFPDDAEPDDAEPDDAEPDDE